MPRTWYFILLTLTLLVWAISARAQQWDLISGYPTTQNLNDVCFIDSVEGWAVGDAGTLLHTTDAGAHWERLQGGTPNSWRFVYFEDPFVGWVSQDFSWNELGGILRTEDGGFTWEMVYSQPRLCVIDGEIPAPGQAVFACAAPDENNAYRALAVRTTDGGRTWSTQSFAPCPWLSSADFTDPLTGWLAASNGQLFHTTDGGDNWTVLSTNGPTGQVSFVNARTGWGFNEGFHGSLLRTVDGGVTWQDTQRPSGYGELEFQDSLQGYYTAYANRASFIAATTDGGASWDTLRTEPADPYDCDHVATIANRYWAVREGGGVHYSSDGGYHWHNQQSGFGTNLSSMTFADDDRGWISDEYGRILRTTDGGASWDSLSSLPCVRRAYPDLSFPDATHGWGIAINEVFLTTDGGATWTAGPRPYYFDYISLCSVDFVDSLHGWLTAFYMGDEDNSTFMWRSVDGGQSWQMLWEHLGGSEWEADFTDMHHGWDKERECFTADAGQTWHCRRPGPSNGIGVRTAPVDSVHCWMIYEHYDRDSLHVYRTDDAGLNWQWKRAVPNRQNLAIAFHSPDSGLVLSGTDVYVTTDGGATWFTEICFEPLGYQHEVVMTPNGTCHVIGDNGLILRRRWLPEWNPEGGDTVRDLRLRYEPNSGDMVLNWSVTVAGDYQVYASALPNSGGDPGNGQWTLVATASFTAGPATWREPAPAVSRRYYLVMRAGARARHAP